MIYTTGQWKKAKKCCNCGMTLFEAVVVLALLGMMFSLVGLNIFGRIKQTRMNEDVSRFARTLRTAAREAVIRQKDLLVVVEVYDGYYSVYVDDPEEPYSEVSEPLLEPEQLSFCWIDEIEFEDGSRQYSGQLRLRATPQGWSGTRLMKLVYEKRGSELRMERYLRCDRFTTKVTVSRQPISMPQAKARL
ncbi:MAG: type II secretion system protein [Sedimentisphaerales bacterium]|nr:type II secretion system protein [Sedimentisphaerales bacterium]